MPSELSLRAGEHRMSVGDAGTYEYFVPKSLPPSEPPLQIDGELQTLLSHAATGIGRLDGLMISGGIPTNILLHSFVRKEAVLSSQIEGTQSSLDDILQFEYTGARGVPIDDIAETLNYVVALEHGFDSLASDRLPLSLRLIRELHVRLLDGTRGSAKAPGEFRKTPVWLGGDSPQTAVFVPPPADLVPDLMADLERFLNDVPVATEPLLKAATSHIQFETIHPFLDGNGRVGRILIPLVLFDAGVLRSPALYLSLFFKQHRERYYEHLQRVRTSGDWEGWIVFFLEGVIEVSAQVIKTAQNVQALVEKHSAEVAAAYGRSSVAHSVYSFAASKVALTGPRVAEQIGASRPAVNKALSRLEADGILSEITGGQRNRVYWYEAFRDLLYADIE